MLDKQLKKISEPRKSEVLEEITSVVNLLEIQQFFWQSFLPQCTYPWQGGGEHGNQGYLRSHYPIPSVLWGSLHHFLVLALQTNKSSDDQPQLINVRPGETTVQRESQNTQLYLLFLPQWKHNPTIQHDHVLKIKKQKI